jgi:zinc protease
MECFNAPKFKESDLITEKELVIQTLLNKSQDPARLCFSKVNEIMFPNHSYGLDSLGTEDTIEKMTVQSLMSLHEKNIKEKEMLICVFGDIGLDLAADFVVKHTNHLSARNAPTPFRTKGKYNSEICHINLDREQNHVYIGVPTKGIFEHDTLVSKMLTSFLSGQSSKLFYEMRDVYGLCYAIRAFQFAALEHGHWGIYFASAPGKTQKAIDIVNQAISTLVRQMNKAQFEKLKLMIDGQNKLAMQTNEDFASAYSLPLLHGKGIEYHHTECEKVAKMKYQDFIKGMNSLLSNHASMVMCGPGIV